MVGECLRFPEKIVESDGLYGHPNDLLVDVIQLVGEFVNTDGKGLATNDLSDPSGWLR